MEKGCLTCKYLDDGNGCGRTCDYNFSGWEKNDPVGTKESAMKQCAGCRWDEDQECTSPESCTNWERYGSIEDGIKSEELDNMADIPIENPIDTKADSIIPNCNKCKWSKEYIAWFCCTAQGNKSTQDNWNTPECKELYEVEDE